MSGLVMPDGSNLPTTHLKMLRYVEMLRYVKFQRYCVPYLNVYGASRPCRGPRGLRTPIRPVPDRPETVIEAIRGAKLTTQAVSHGEETFCVGARRTVLDTLSPSGSGESPTVIVSIVEHPPGARRVTHAGLAALRCGPPDGEIVLLLPGYTGSKEDYAPILPRLAEAGFTAIALDQRGQFESTPETEDADEPDDGEAAGRYKIASLAADVHRVVDELARPVHLVGHSFGGLVARAAIIGRPEIVASLTLLGSGPGGIVGPRRRALKAIYSAYTRGGRMAVWRAIQAADTADYPPGVVEFHERRFFASSEVALRVMRIELLEEPDRVGELAAVAAGHGVPLLVTHGACDDAWPPALQAEMAHRLGARYEVVPGAMHSPAMQNPAGTAAVLVSFLREVRRARAA